MASRKKKLGTSVKVLISIGIAILALAVIWGVYAYAASLPQIGATTTSKAIISEDSAVGGILSAILGVEGISLESLILHLAVFAIIMFAVADIVTVFSSFSEGTSWVIGAGFALIAGVTNILPWVAGLFATGAAIGAFGIVIIVIAAFVAAVSLNVGVGRTLRKWRLTRQIEIESMKSGKGAASVASAIRGFKKADNAFKEDNRN
ncbi:hypothetical protein CMI45_00330 [Candidatus Pacearchaeota archaeon]|nr:hypothetical protein [Candidatus Pacearchaeota archaeon]|tara:strand:- start:94 stop:708 length:615 start_codon:yes stop_codon:yes gene_type:complete